MSATGSAFVIRRATVLAAQCGSDGGNPDFAEALKIADISGKSLRLPDSKTE